MAVPVLREPRTPAAPSPPSAYDPFYSGEITTLGPPLPEAPDSPPIPVIRDGKKIFEIINAELTRRKVQYFKMQYNAGLEHSIRSEMQMFVDYDTPSFPAKEGLKARMNGDYADGMWAGFDEGGYGWGRGSTAFIRGIHHDCYGIHVIRSRIHSGSAAAHFPSVQPSCFP